MRLGNSVGAQHRLHYLKAILGRFMHSLMIARFIITLKKSGCWLLIGMGYTSTCVLLHVATAL